MHPRLEADLQKKALRKSARGIPERIQWLAEEKRYIEEIQGEQSPDLHRSYEKRIVDATKAIYTTFLRALNLRCSLERRHLGAASWKPRSAYAAGRRSPEDRRRARNYRRHEHSKQSPRLERLAAKLAADLALDPEARRRRSTLDSTARPLLAARLRDVEASMAELGGVHVRLA
ncbi:hypothetical protein GGTG_06896 [Gaeumannomyces tritici R3-111a-1]|uniref:Uncharacterized protein n=1 Tax=Gaeumannomyces tritici (strain R3-111a-1) TaxID=644352 RepID=J3P049_GAET3|nr:hypothetical protein GGTG_06896 [Gaeumannomyces tritici R3-111a-1]EJT76982.1 hypothetical protein GGTG_06896 [Gaeumannomyces tritici R3-111a-1]